ncbi:SURF1 family protein [Profundibacterium mesophilum]|uniref:SURF1-like protein n=1 Tax=Profundibacterium mesophilum KAUST100406-0324 TaxID=1037889 RepID=A0A921NR03_9RHOB|nr:SURF1 family protein [Profundibacterium mesophilum]KAF0675797.1 SURF1 family domain containing protein [Profundibacterium mesophilum KAUST100406-0324]
MRTFLAILLGLVGCALLLSLGVWQVKRMAWKQEILTQIETRIGERPQAVPQSPDPARDRYLPVEVSGTLGARELHVLVSTRELGAGYRIIAPLLGSDGRTLLADLGWTATASKDTPRPRGPVTITGNLHWPQEIDGFTPEPQIDDNIWFARDVPRMAAALGAEPVLVIARSFEGTDPGTVPLPVTTAGIPNDHLSYALTWFSLAAIWAGMTGLLLWRIHRRAI